MADVIQQLDPYRLTIWQGKTFLLDMAYTEPDGLTPIPLDGYIGRGQVRPFPGGPLLADFGVTIDGPSGGITLELTPDETREIQGKAVYDVELVSGSRVIGILHGDIEVIQGVTEP